MARPKPLLQAALLLLLGLVLAPDNAQSTQDPVQKADGLCASFVLYSGSPYSCDEYVVQTSDGFLLGVQRMSRGAQTTAKPVFLYHGLLSGGDSYMLNPPGNSLPFMLADAGYDVWIGNTRTTRYSSGHVTLTTNDEGFWDWSLDELAGIDLPAMVGLVSSETSSTVHYVGFSQGSQAAVAAFSEGQLLSMVDKVVFMAPVVLISNIKSVMAIAAGDFLLDQMMLFMHVYEFNPQIEAGQKMLDMICNTPSAREDCYKGYLQAFAGTDCCLNSTRMSYIGKYAMQSTSMKNLAHLAQIYRTSSFAKYDYGPIQNLEKYESFFPPSYDVSSIPAMNMLLLHGSADALADVDDVNTLLEDINFAPQHTLISNYGHLDFLGSTTANTDVYSKILSFFAS